MRLTGSDPVLRNLDGTVIKGRVRVATANVPCLFPAYGGENVASGVRKTGRCCCDGADVVAWDRSGEVSVELLRLTLA
jgi:hypothetical protein